MKTFERLPHFTGDAWQGSDKYPDAALGWVKLTVEGGHPGNDMQHAAVRRWISPITGAVAITGAIAHGTEAGNGIAARVVSSRSGVLGEWTLHNSKVEVALTNIAADKGDSIDFVVDIAVTEPMSSRGARRSRAQRRPLPKKAPTTKPPGARRKISPVPRNRFRNP